MQKQKNRAKEDYIEKKEAGESNDKDHLIYIASK